MKEKSQIEKKAEEKQTELLSAALGGQGISPALSARGLGQPVQCPLYGLAFGQ